MAQLLDHDLRLTWCVRAIILKFCTGESPEKRCRKIRPDSSGSFSGSRVARRGAMTTLAAVKTILQPGRLRPLGRQTKTGRHPNDVWNPGTDGKCLIIILHQFGGRPDDLDSLMNAVQETVDLRNLSVFVPVLPLHYTSFHDPSQIVADLLDKIDSLFSEKTYESVILIGHSIGSLLARKLYIAACGEIEGCPLEPPLSGAKPKVWAPCVKRIVLLAGMNRGWSISNDRRNPGSLR